MFVLFISRGTCNVVHYAGFPADKFIKSKKIMHKKIPHYSI